MQKIQNYGLETRLKLEKENAMKFNAGSYLMVLVIWKRYITDVIQLLSITFIKKIFINHKFSDDNFSSCKQNQT